jgi:hypothetical protein
MRVILYVPHRASSQHSEGLARCGVGEWVPPLSVASWLSWFGFRQTMRMHEALALAMYREVPQSFSLGVLDSATEHRQIRIRAVISSPTGCSFSFTFPVWLLSANQARWRRFFGPFRYAGI